MYRKRRGLLRCLGCNSIGLILIKWRVAYRSHNSKKALVQIHVDRSSIIYFIFVNFSVLRKLKKGSSLATWVRFIRAFKSFLETLILANSKALSSISVFEHSNDETKKKNMKEINTDSKP